MLRRRFLRIYNERLVKLAQNNAIKGCENRKMRKVLIIIIHVSGDWRNIGRL